MRNKKSANSKNARHGAECPHQKLAESFRPPYRAWQQHGREILHGVMAERPELYFQALVRLTLLLHRQLPEPPGFDRRPLSCRRIAAIAGAHSKRKATIGTIDFTHMSTLKRHLVGRSKDQSNNSGLRAQARMARACL